MVCRDIGNFYPSCNTRKCLEAVERLLNTREQQIPSTECISEAIEIMMSSNSMKFIDRSLTQIDRTTIGSPDSGSITEIFGAIHTDKKFGLECPKIENYKRYREARKLQTI